MKHIGLKVITCEDHDRLSKNKPPGTGFGKHHYCPKTAEEAYQIVSGNQNIKSISTILFENYWNIDGLMYISN